MSFVYKDNKQLKNELKKVVIDNDLTMAEVAKRCDLLPQQLNNRFNNSRVGFNDMRQYLNCIGYDLVIDFIKR